MKKLNKSNAVLTIAFLILVTVTSLGTYFLHQHTLKVSKITNVPSVHQVLLNKNNVSPDSLTVKGGESVQFNSNDGKSHKIALGEGGHEHDHEGSFSSGEFKANEAWRATFKEPGTYFFHDHLNPDINVLVVAYK